MGSCSSRSPEHEQLVGLGGLFVAPDVLADMPLAIRLVLEQPVISGGVLIVIVHALLRDRGAPGRLTRTDASGAAQSA